MNLLTPQDFLESPLFEVLVFCFGLLVGSFANVCIHRLPRDLSVVRPRSRCPSCGHEIAGYDNIPVLSWILLLGRCRGCRAPISARYPAVELANALGWLLLAVLRGPTLEGAAGMLLFTALLVLGLIDLEHQILPNVITLPGVVFGLAVSLLPGDPTPLSSASAAAGGYLACWAMAAAWFALRKEEALGQGDWKMIAMLGAFFGWEGMTLSVFLASLVGTVVGLGLILFQGQGMKTKVPLGTFLALGGMVTLFVGPMLLDAYRGLYGLE